MLVMESVFSVPEHVLFNKVAGEAVLLNLESGVYYGLNGVGTRMWSLLAEHRQVEPIIRILALEYRVDEKQLRQDIGDLVAELVAHDLLSLDST